MGVYVDTILDREVETLEQAQEAAAAMVAWLVDRRIIEDRQCDACFGDGPCYPAGRDFMLVHQTAPGDTGTGADEPSHAAMRVAIGREFLFSRSAGFDTVACPKCRKDVDIRNYLDAGSDWLEGGPDTVACPDCGATSPLREWEHDGSGFVMLAFEFFDWPEPSPEFIDAFARRLGHRITYFSEKR
ncbi:hypothetical protein GJV26_16350 [Massilia dura]|uniref:Sugar ABC transporter ATPase n=1 Tax=Pseudoduganella dura TaxID=321982 RepID=A0A6I3XAT3_9BURK|nr:hypothetical protein [Pseudoduganella dura]MUI14014.1 hypothetical protein [Pseudoduganella dura]GGX91908.1 hypothetical protein GCM10007386_23580 [Pseudoduganella dura]